MASLAFIHTKSPDASVEGLFEGASYVEPRVKYVKGWLTGGVDPNDGSVECGDGTAYPIRVTAAQLSAIMYRVRDARFTAGSFSISTFGDDLTIKASTEPLPQTLVDSSDDFQEYVTIRGYCAYSNDVAPNGPLPHVDANGFGNTYYYTNGYYNIAARDIANNELAIWSNGDSGDPKDASWIGKYWDNNPSIGGALVGSWGLQLPSFRTGFNQTFTVTDSTSVYGIAYGVFGDVNGIEVPTEASINFFGGVAFLDLTGSGDPLDPGNEMYAEFNFSGALFASFGGTLTMYFSSNREVVYTGPMLGAGISVIVHLGAGLDPVLCSLYYDEDLATSGGNDPGYILTASNFEIEAAEWWDYDPDPPPAP